MDLSSLQLIVMIFKAELFYTLHYTRYTTLDDNDSSWFLLNIYIITINNIINALVHEYMKIAVNHCLSCIFNLISIIRIIKMEFKFWSILYCSQFCSFMSPEEASTPHLTYSVTDHFFLV